MELHQQPILGDAFGVALLAELGGTPAGDVHFVERSDGYLEATSTTLYFQEEIEWTVVDRLCLERLHGRVLDIGARAGRLSLAAQRRGLPVVALDTSSGAVEVCRGRVSRTCSTARSTSWPKLGRGRSSTRS